MANGKISEKRTSKPAPLPCLAIGILLTFCFYMLGTHSDAHVIAKNYEAPVILEEKMSIDPSTKKELVTEPLKPSREMATEVKPKLVQSSKPITPKISTSKYTNARTTWDYLIAQGFTREQTAGIMGNLQQEHNFKTHDTAGGLGIVQWIGARRANLIARGNSADLKVQLDYMMEELRGTEKRAYNSILRSKSIESATIAFQNNYERCGLCKQAQRIQYAYEWYGRF